MTAMQLAAAILKAITRGNDMNIPVVVEVWNDADEDYDELPIGCAEYDCGKVRIWV